MGKMTYNHFQPAFSRWNNVQTMCHGIFTAGRRTVTGVQGWSKRGCALNERHLGEIGLACSAVMPAPPSPPHVNWQELDTALIPFSCGDVFICIPPPSSNVHSRQEAAPPRFRNFQELADTKFFMIDTTVSIGICTLTLRVPQATITTT